MMGHTEFKVLLSIAQSLNEIKNLLEETVLLLTSIDEEQG